MPPSSPLTPLLTGVVAALDQRNWPAALHLALDMPILCANLDPRFEPLDGVRSYAGWFDRFVLRHLRNEACSPSRIEEATRGHEFEGHACYALRCACLGGDGAEVRGRRLFVMGADGASVAYEVALSYPALADSSGAVGVVTTRDARDDGEVILHVDVHLLCMCIAKGVLSWLWDVTDDPAVERRLRDMIEIEGASATGRRPLQERQAG